MREKAAIFDELGLPHGHTLRTAAASLEASARSALAAPEDMSEKGTLDDMIATLQSPSVWPTRPLALWSFTMLRRARSLMRHLLHGAEITEPAETIVATQTWLKDVEEGPPSRPHSR